MFSLFGAPALSQFRLDQLLRVLRAEEPRVWALTSRWVHFLDTSRNLSDSELDLLGKLLTYGPRETACGRRESARRPDPPTLETGNGHRILVTPRLGTES